MTSAWKTSTGNYRVQTDCIETHRKLRRRKSMTLAGVGMNLDLWIYAFSARRPSEALKMVEAVSGQPMVKHGTQGLFLAKNDAMLRLKT